MPKPKRWPQFVPIPLRFTDSSITEANAIGNNAAWMCPCGYALPLIASLVIAREVACPKCDSKYRVVADANNRASKVEQF